MSKQSYIYDWPDIDVRTSRPAVPAGEIELSDSEHGLSGIAWIGLSGVARRPKEEVSMTGSCDWEKPAEGGALNVLSWWTCRLAVPLATLRTTRPGLGVRSILSQTGSESQRSQPRTAFDPRGDKRPRSRCRCRLLMTRAKRFRRRATRSTRTTTSISGDQVDACASRRPDLLEVGSRDDGQRATGPTGNGQRASVVLVRA